MSYWTALQEPPPEYDGLRVLQIVSPVNPDLLSQRHIASCLRGSATIRRTQCEQLARLPVHRVDPDAAAYGVELVTLRMETTSLAEALAELMDNPSGLPDGGAFLIEVLVSLGRHANDEDGVWQGALKDQAVARSNDVGQAIDRARSLEQRATELQDRTHSLKAKELAVRVKLAERYDREFPACIPRDVQPMVLAEGSAGSPRGKDEIARDLLQRSLGPDWQFDTLEEFRSLVIARSKTSGQLAVIEVDTSVTGRFSGMNHQFRLRLLYQKGTTGWQLAVVERIPHS